MNVTPEKIEIKSFWSPLESFSDDGSPTVGNTFPAQHQDGLDTSDEDCIADLWESALSCRRQKTQADIELSEETFADHFAGMPN